MTRRGSILIISMIILFAIAGVALTLARNARTDMALAANIRSSRQAEAIERGAEQYVIGMLTDYSDSLADMTDSDFAQIPVGDGYFWICRTDYGDNDQPIYGFIDESAKVNLNTGNAEAMKRMPGMTDQIAGAIVDWRDADTNASTSGMENYDTYTAKNADFEAPEEMLMLNGMTRDLYYGVPANQASDIVGSDYYIQHGLNEFFTCWSSQPNTAADGTARINLNSPQSRDQLRQLLTSKLSNGTRATAIIASIGTQPITDIFDMASKARMTSDEINSIFDFVTSGTGGGGQASQPKRGLININEAPREVLLTLGNLTESDVDTLLANRASAVQTYPNTVGWVYDALKEKSVGLGSLITTQGKQFSAEIVAVGHGGRAFKRVRIVVDTTQTPVKIIYRRDLTSHGWPMDPQILTQIQSGQSPSSSSGLALGGMR